MTLSPEVQAQVDELAERFHREGTPKVHPAIRDFVTILHALTLEAERDEQALRCLAMLNDVIARGIKADILRAFTGDVAFTIAEDSIAPGTSA